VREGGVVLLAAECAEGMGQPHFEEMVTWRKSAKELLEMVLAPGFAELEQWAIQCQTMVQVKADVYLHSAMSRQETERAHLKHCADVQATLAALRERFSSQDGGHEPSILVLPYGQLTVPRVEG
jgi:nickel-dependent lactate racemase